ncbi:MAG TPA: hypothetical protein VFB62_26735 [Polyangiaceae bacterium]|nr:hypothetical protein [Polyangiaceae bacterium]
MADPLGDVSTIKRATKEATRERKPQANGRAGANLKALLKKSVEREIAKPHQIFVDHDLPRYVDEAIAVLREDETLFSRAGSLVRVRRTGAPRKRAKVRREPGSLVIEVYPVASMREQLISRVFFFRIEAEDDPVAKKLKQVPCGMPSDLVSTLRARAEWPGVRDLTGIVTAPTLRSDGTILQTAGYDGDSALFYDPSGESFPHVRETPTRDDARAALERLFDVVVDVPFSKPEHKAGWLALVLTAIGRPWIDGCVPLFAIDANVRGAGKSLVADVAAIISSGHVAPRMAQPESDAEARKTITSLLLEGERLCLIDNVSRPLGSASLDALLTSEIWKDRVLGANKVVTLPNTCTWMSTGNNLSFAGDTIRRTLHIRLDSPLENPEAREGFRYPDLRTHVRQYRGELAAAALTILRAYVVAGMPTTVKLWGSFEDWSKKIAATCVWLGLPDPQVTRIELEAAGDTTKAALSTILAFWPRLFPDGSTIKNAIQLLYPKVDRAEQRAPDGWDPLREALEEIASSMPGRPPGARQLGYEFRRAKKRVVGGRMLDCIADRTKTSTWVVRER